jgi:adenosine deaminase
MTDSLLRDKLRALPKAELHCHFEGTVPVDLFRELAAKNGVALPPGNPYGDFPEFEEFEQQAASMPRWVFRALGRKYQRAARTAEDLYALAIYEQFLDRFDLVCESIVSADDFSRAAYASLTEAASVANVRYREMFFHPLNHPGVPYRTMVEGLLDGIRAAEQDCGIVTRLIPAINRDFSAAAGRALVDEVLSDRPDEVVGLASDYDEEHLPAFAEAYDVATRNGLPVTAHCGEFSGADSIRECIELLGCRRVDHGYAVVTEPTLMSRAREEGTHFTCILSASVAIHEPNEWPLDPPVDGVAPARVSTPIAGMLGGGLSLSLGSDDPAFDGFGDLGTEYIWAAEALELDFDAMARLSLEALDACWLDESSKGALRKRFLDEIDAVAQLDDSSPG